MPGSATTAAAASGTPPAAPAAGPPGGRVVTGGRVVELLVGYVLGYVLVRLDHVNLDLEVHFQVVELGGVEAVFGQIDITGINVGV